MKRKMVQMLLIGMALSTVQFVQTDINAYADEEEFVEEDYVEEVLSEEPEEDPELVYLQNNSNGDAIDNGKSNTFSKENAVAGVAVIDDAHTLKLETDANGLFAGAKILKADGTVDTGINSYIANVVTKYAADGTPEEFYSLIFRNGVWDTSYDTVKDGLYQFRGEQYSVAGGTVNLNVNSLTYTGDIDGWKYIILGHVVKDHAGLVAYGPADDLHWFWIDAEGSCDTEYNAIVKWNGADFLVHGGRLRTDYTGFTYDPQNESVWYHITNGQVWGDGEITDQSIAGGNLTCVVENGIVKEMGEASIKPYTNTDGYLVFGSYEQDGDLSNGKEPIEWQILGTDDNGTLVVSRYVLSAATRNIGYSEFMDSFANTAFLQEERALINETENSSEIFNLDHDQVLHYFDFNTYTEYGPITFSAQFGGYSGYGESLIAFPTAYAAQKGPIVATITQEYYDESLAELGYSQKVVGLEAARWFTRNSFVGYDGQYTHGGTWQPGLEDNIPCGIRPAMYINL